MKKIISIMMLLAFFGLQAIHAQTIYPDIYFDDEPGPHNMSITSDGNYYYSCNGGKTYEGKISKFSLNGNFMKSYDIDLDMRSIMYNPSDKHFYVNCYDNNIYMITDLESGAYKLVYSKLYSNEQASLALGPKGKYLYCLDEGILKVYDFATGSVDETYYGFRCGSELGTGNASVAVSKKYIITTDAADKVFYVYDKKGKLKESVRYAEGDYGFSLSYANGHIFMATDGNYGMGKWYGYEFK